MSDLRFDPDTLRRAGAGMGESSRDLADRTQAVLAECGDLSVLGTNDTLGAVAQLLYSAVLTRVQDTVDSIVGGTGDHAELLGLAAAAYEEVEAVNAELGADLSRLADSGMTPAGWS